MNKASNLGFPGGSDGKECTLSVGDWGSIPGLGRSPGEGEGYPLQDSGLMNPKDRGPWQATVHGVSESDTAEWLSPSLFIKPVGMEIQCLKSVLFNFWVLNKLFLLIYFLLFYGLNIISDVFDNVSTSFFRIIISFYSLRFFHFALFWLFLFLPFIL